MKVKVCLYIRHVGCYMHTVCQSSVYECIQLIVYTEHISLVFIYLFDKMLHYSFYQFADSLKQFVKIHKYLIQRLKTKAKPIFKQNKGASGYKILK